MSWFKGTDGDIEKEMKKQRRQEEIKKQRELEMEKRELEEKNRRFEIVLEEELSGRQFEIIKDRKTGICYLWRRNFGSESSGFTVLMDEDGKPFKDDSEN